MDWWKTNNMRLIQNNFIDLNAGMDVDRWLSDLKSFDCNVALVGVGGVTSFFPTKLQYQVVSTYLPEGRDLIREILEKCHAAGIRVMGRFDFGRAHEKFYTMHPEWFYRSADGRLLRVADTVTTCICGYYQQEYALEIVREAMERYPEIDGIFFNAYGFTSWDYYGNNYGPCHCENCQRAFREFAGLELPANEQDPSMSEYLRFQREMVSRTLHRMQSMIRSIKPEACLCTYATDGVDLIKSESNSAVGRPLPFMLMHSSFNMATTRHTWPSQPLDNCVINATDLRWRYAGVSPNLTQIRLYENIAAGGFPDFCINGVFADYPDQASLEPVREVYRYHAQNEEYYGSLISQARLVVLRTDDGRSAHDGSPELYGIMKALKEEHILFDVQTGTNLLQNPSLLEQYEAVLVPDLTGVSDGFLRMAGKSGKTVMISAVNKPLRESCCSLLGIRIERVENDNSGAYLETRQKDIFRHFSWKDWVFVTGDVGLVDAPGYEQLLPYVEKGNFGPAERAYGYRRTDRGTVLKKGNVTLITWSLGKLYHQYGCQDHKYILADLLDALCPAVRVLRTTAHPSVELFWDDCGQGMLLQALNLSGFNGTTAEAPVPMVNVSVTVPCKGVTAFPLTETSVTLLEAEDGTIVTFDCLDRFAATVLK